MSMIYFALSRMFFFFRAWIADKWSSKSKSSDSKLLACAKMAGDQILFKKKWSGLEKKIQQIRLLGALGKERFGILLNLDFLANNVL